MVPATYLSLQVSQPSDIPSDEKRGTCGLGKRSSKFKLLFVKTKINVYINSFLTAHVQTVDNSCGSTPIHRQS